MINLPISGEKFFYIWDFEWMNNIIDFDVILKTYMNHDIKLVARSQDHVEFLENIFNRSVNFTLDNFKLKESKIWNIC